MVSGEEPGHPCQTQGHPGPLLRTHFNPRAAGDGGPLRELASSSVSVKPQPRLPPTLRTDGDKAPGGADCTETALGTNLCPPPPGLGRAPPPDKCAAVGRLRTTHGPGAGTRGGGSGKRRPSASATPAPQAGPTQPGSVTVPPTESWESHWGALCWGLPGKSVLPREGNGVDTEDCAPEDARSCPACPPPWAGPQASACLLTAEWITPSVTASSRAQWKEPVRSETHTTAKHLQCWGREGSMRWLSRSAHTPARVPCPVCLMTRGSQAPPRV